MFGLGGMLGGMGRAAGGLGGMMGMPAMGGNNDMKRQALLQALGLGAPAAPAAPAMPQPMADSSMPAQAMPSPAMPAPVAKGLPGGAMGHLGRTMLGLPPEPPQQPRGSQVGLGRGLFGIR